MFWNELRSLRKPPIMLGKLLDFVAFKRQQISGNVSKVCVSHKVVVFNIFKIIWYKTGDLDYP